MNRKGLVGLAAFGAIAAIFALAITMAVVVMKPTEALGNGELIVTIPAGFSSTSPNANVTFTFYVFHSNTSSNVTNITVYFPAGFAFREGSNVTNISGFRFQNSSTGRSLNFSNGSVAAGNQLAVLNNTYTSVLQFNLSVANYSGLYNFTVMTIDHLGGTNTTTVNIVNNVQASMGKTDWTYCGPKGTGVTNTIGCIGPGINNTGSFFFYDGNNVTVIINITDQSGMVPVQNLTVLVNFTEIGNNTFGANSKGLVPATYNAGNGTYYAIGTVNFTNASTFVGSLNNNLKPAFIRILVDACTGSPSPTCNIAGANVMNSTASPMTVALMVNMSYFGCPPADDAQAAQMWSSMPPMPYRVSGSNTTSVSPAGCVEYNNALNSSINASSTPTHNQTYDTAYTLPGLGFPPLVYNGSRYLLVAPYFGGGTTNISEWAANRRNMSAVYFVLDFPGKARINFTSGIDFTSPDSMQGIMEFAMKSLMSGGAIGMNESEWDGSNASGRAKPKLNISARLTLYNLTQYGFTSTAGVTMGYGTYNGSNKPTTILPCTSSRCSNIFFNGTELTFTVGTWSTYVVGSTNYSLQFKNGTSSLASVRQAILPANTSAGSRANATFFLNITNIGNSSETYNITVAGLPECNVTASSVVYSDKVCVTFNTSSPNGTFVTLDPNASALLRVNVTANSTPGTYTFGIVAYKHESTNNTNTTWNLNSTGDGDTWVVTVSPFLINILPPTNGSNVTTAVNLVFGLTGNVSTIMFVNYTINTSLTQGFFNNTLARGVINWSINNSGNINLTTQGWQQMQNVTVWVNDTWGNVNSTIVSFVVDNTIPTASNFSYKIGSGAVTVLNTTYYANMSNTSVIINVTAHDASTGIFSVQLNVSNATQVNLTNMTFVVNTSFGNNNYTLTLNPNSNQFADGQYNLSVIIRDWTDNVNGTLGTANLTGYITIDKTAPIVTIQRPGNAGNLIINSTAFTFNVTVADATTLVDGVVFNLTNNSGAFGVNTSYLAGSVVRDNSTNGMTANFSIPFNLATLQDGNYTFKVIANDTLNNVNTSATITFTVDNTVPTIVTWNYSLITQQINIRFSEVVDYATLDMSKINITYNNGDPLFFRTANFSLNDGTGGATKHTATNATVMIINLTPSQDVKMRELQSAGQGQMMASAAAVRDPAGNVLTAKNMTIGNNWTVYGIEMSFLTSIWGSFNLPLTTLQNRSSLSSNYSADNVLASIRGNYAGIYYYSSGSWASYVPGRAVNTFTTFSDDTSTNNYWVYMTASDKLQIT